MILNPPPDSILISSLSPLGPLTPSSSPVHPNALPSVSPWLRWAVHPSTCPPSSPLFFLLLYPASALKLLLLPIVLYANWELVSPYIQPGIQNPFRSLFLLSGRVPSSPADKPLYAKTYEDLLFIAFYIVFFSFVRQLIAVKACRPVARYFGIKREAKLDRFGEQGYALVYFMVFGAWGYVSLSYQSSSSTETFLLAHHGPIAYMVVSYRILLDQSVQFQYSLSYAYAFFG